MKWKSVSLYSSRHLLLLSWRRSSWKTGVAVTTLWNTSSCHLTAPLRLMVKHTNISSFTERCCWLVQPRYDFRAKGINFKLHLALETSIFYLVLERTKYYICMSFYGHFVGKTHRDFQYLYQGVQTFYLLITVIFSHWDMEPSHVFFFLCTRALQRDSYSPLMRKNRLALNRVKSLSAICHLWESKC